jgi:hypothetical protein
MMLGKKKRGCIGAWAVLIAVDFFLLQPLAEQETSHPQIVGGTSP